LIRPGLGGHGALIVSTALTLLVQSLASLVALSVPVLWPEIAADRRLDSALIGFYPAIMYSAALFVLLHSGRLLDRFGPMGLSVACVIVAGLGLALFMVPLPSLLLCVAGALLIGFGYGPITPASSLILSSRVPPRMANLIFSIKQTGVPIGGILAGAVIPSLIAWSSWRIAGLLIAGGAVAIGVALLPTVPAMDRDHLPTGGGRRKLLDPLRMLMAKRPMRNLALASLTFAAMQLCLAAFLTVHLVQTVHLSLIDAGAVFATTQLAGVAGRIGWAVMADRFLSPTATMVALGLQMAVAFTAIGCFGPSWPLFLMVAICILCGSSGSGWVGLVLSELVRFAPPGDAGIITAAAQIVMFVGVLIGPLLFSAVLSLTGEFRAAFVAIAVFTLIGAGFAARAKT
jgi:MFS family permease